MQEIKNWEQYDEMVEEEIASSSIRTGLLKAQLSTLLLVKKIDFETEIRDICNILFFKHSISYTPDQVEEELKIIQIENEIENREFILEDEEDFFEGY